MKKLLTVLFLITSVTMLYAEAPELKNMMHDAQQLAKSNPADRTGRSGVFEES